MILKKITVTALAFVIARRRPFFLLRVLDCRIGGVALLRAFFTVLCALLRGLRVARRFQKVDDKRNVDNGRYGVGNGLRHL